MQICYYHITFSCLWGKRWNILINLYEDASVTSPALILLLTCDWWMTGFNKIQSTLADLMKFGMQTYVKVCFLYGMGGCRVALVIIRSCVCVYVCYWRGAGGGITLMKNKFQKASITSAQAQAPAFAFQCEVQPPLFMTLYTSKPRPASLYLAHSLSPLIPIVTTSTGSPETLFVCTEGKRRRPVGWFGTSRRLIGDNKQEVNLDDVCIVARY